MIRQWKLSQTLHGLCLGTASPELVTPGRARRFTWAQACIMGCSHCAGSAKLALNSWPLPQLQKNLLSHQTCL